MMSGSMLIRENQIYSGLFQIVLLPNLDCYAWCSILAIESSCVCLPDGFGGYEFDCSRSGSIYFLFCSSVCDAGRPGTCVLSLVLCVTPLIFKDIVHRFRSLCWSWYRVCTGA